MVDGSTRGLFNSSGIVDSSYVIVSASICASTCGEGPMCGVCVLVPFIVRTSKYGYSIGVIFCY